MPQPGAGRFILTLIIGACAVGIALRGATFSDMRTQRACLIAILSAVGCTEPVAPLESSGDQTVFAGIDVRIDESQYDHLNYSHASRPPPIEHSRSVYVIVNRGTESARIRELQIGANGQELREVGSAGLPQQFSYPYEMRHPTDAPIILSFEYRGARFVLPVFGLGAQIISPAEGAEFTVKEPVPIRWKDKEGSPPQISVEVRYYGAVGTGGCMVGYRTAVTGPNEALAGAEMRPDGKGPPCSGEASVVWGEQHTPASPFKSLVIHQTISLLKRIHVR